MKRSRPSLEDADYDKQVERLSGLPKFPALPTAQKELRRAMRRITETDIAFLRKLIDDVVDTATVCPTPADLIQMAGAKRNRTAQNTHETIGRPDCPYCEGTGFTIFYRRVSPGGVEPYEASFAAVCTCRGGGRGQ